MTLRIPFGHRARKYGYIFWTIDQDGEVEDFLEDAKSVEVWFEHSLLGRKRIDWKHRRISIGWSNTRGLPEKVSEFRLTWKRDGVLNLVCE